MRVIMALLADARIEEGIHASIQKNGILAIQDLTLRL